MANPSSENFTEEHHFDGEHFPNAWGYCGKIESKTALVPGALSEKFTWIVPVGTGYAPWIGHEKEIAVVCVWTPPVPVTWYFTIPVKGNLAYVRDEGLVYIFDGTNWQPLIPGIKFPNPMVIYESPDVAYRFPPLVIIPSSTVQAYEFGIVGKDEGFSGHFQVPARIPTYDIGLHVKFSAENITGGQQSAQMDFQWKVINSLGSMDSAAGFTSDTFLLNVPAGSTELILRYSDFSFIPRASLSDDCTVIIKLFARDSGHVLDTLASRLLVVEVEPKFL